jgi:hypothetical protein
MNPIDSGLDRLSRDGREHELDTLERDVLARIQQDTRADVFRGRTLSIQLAVSCVALLVGLAVAQFAHVESPSRRSEAAVLSDDSGLAPSIALEGGA